MGLHWGSMGIDLLGFRFIFIWFNRSWSQQSEGLPYAAATPLAPRELKAAARKSEIRLRLFTELILVTCAILNCVISRWVKSSFKPQRFPKSNLHIQGRTVWYLFPFRKHGRRVFSWSTYYISDRDWRTFSHHITSDTTSSSRLLHLLLILQYCLVADIFHSSFPQ